MHTSNPGVLDVSPGGVGRNIAEALGRLGACPLLISAVGADGLGEMVLSRLQQLCSHHLVMAPVVPFHDELVRTSYHAQAEGKAQEAWAGP